MEGIRSTGIVVEGVASFAPEASLVASYCLDPVTGIRLFHSAGDLQKAYNGREVKKGDTVYFNAALLIWHEPLVQSIATTTLAIQQVMKVLPVLLLFNHSLTEHRRS